MAHEGVCVIYSKIKSLSTMSFGHHFSGNDLHHTFAFACQARLPLVQHTGHDLFGKQDGHMSTGLAVYLELAA